MDVPSKNGTQQQKSYCLTQSQLMLWMGQQINPESPMYNMALAFDLDGAIEVPAFQTAFQALLKGSDAMRTVFKIEEEEPVQQILVDFQYELALVDWSMESDASVEQKLEVQSQQLFDLSTRLFDALLIKRAEDRYIWYFNQHHLITDAWSVALLYKEMVSLYQKALEGQLEQTPSLPQFKNYIAYEQTAHQNQTEATNYWHKKIEEAPELPQFYGHREWTMDSRSQRLRLDLGQERSNHLRALTKETDLRSWTQHLSLFNIFASTLLAFMYRVSAQQKLSFGTPAHNRSTPEFKATPGMFIKIFPIITAIEEGESFKSLIQKVRNEANQFLRYAQTGSSTPDLNRGFNATLNYINVSFSDFNGIPMRSNWIHSGHCDPGHHLSLQVHDFDASGSIQLCFDLNEQVFPDPIREQVPGHFLQLLDAFIEDRSQAISAVPLLSETALEQMTIGFNQQSKFDFNYASITHLFEAQVKAQPDAKAIRFGQQHISYQALNEKANQWARQLQAHSVEAGDRIALYLTRSPELLIGILAAFKLGANYVPIPSNYPSNRVSEILEDANVKILLSSPSLKGKLSDLTVPTVLMDHHLDLSSFESNNLNHHSAPEQAAYIMYTSGSTGKPKGVVIEHRSLSHYIQWGLQKYTSFGKPNVPLFSSIGFDLTVTSLFIPLVSGGCAVIYEEVLDAPDLAIFNVIEDNLVDFIKLTPAHLSLLKGMDLSDSLIKSMVVGGEDLKASLAQEVHQMFGGNLHIYNEYGPTEATVGSVVQLFDPKIHLKNSVPIGIPIPNTQVYVLDDFFHPVPIGVPGELYLSGIDLARGYWQQEKLTEEKFIPHPFQEGKKMYRTGDLVCFNREGSLTYLGRKDQQVKIRGRRIELGEIEEALNRHSKIEDCVVDLKLISQQKEEQNSENVLIAYYLSDSEIDEAELIQHLSILLPDYMIPFQLIRLEQIPLTTNGKVDRTALPQPDRVSPRLAIEYVAPRNDIEAMLVDIWSEVLLIDRIGVFDQFLHLGGHSLSAIRLTARINEALELDLPLSLVFQRPTIAAYAQYVETTIESLLSEMNSSQTET